MLQLMLENEGKYSKRVKKLFQDEVSGFDSDFWYN
jgi:hypothetical protein